VPQRNIWTNQIPKTIQQHADKLQVQADSTKSTTSTQHNKKFQKTADTNTATTTTTYQSDNIDIISDLQDKSRQHTQNIEDHNNCLNLLSQQVEELQEMQAWSTQILNLETKYTHIIKQNDEINTETNTVINTSLPNIISTLIGQRQIITHNQEQQDHRNNEMKSKLYKQQKEINELYMLLNTLHTIQNNSNTPQANATPSDSRRRKKSKNRAQNIKEGATFEINLENNTNQTISTNSASTVVQDHTGNDTHTETSPSRNDDTLMSTTILNESALYSQRSLSPQFSQISNTSN
jgi:hypothetical protein